MYSKLNCSAIRVYFFTNQYGERNYQYHVMIRGDFILVKNLVVNARAGVDAWQRTLAQPLHVSLRIGVGNRFQQLALTDDLRRTLNYDALCTRVSKNLETESFKSAETAARAVLHDVKKLLLPNEFVEVSVNLPKSVLQSQGKRVLISSREDIVTESLKNLQIPVIIGVNELERVYYQQLQLNFDVRRKALNSEVFNLQFVTKLKEYIAKTRWLTVESFANDVVRLFAEQDAIDVTLRVAKPCALNLADAAAVQVTRPVSELRLPNNADTRVATPSRGKGNASPNTVYLAFGTNVGARFDNVRSAIPALKSVGITVEQTSQMYESEPMYYKDQQPFINGMFRCTTPLSPSEVLKAVKDVEYNMFSRVKLFDNGPRTLDLDIVLYNNEYIDTPELTVPHRDMLNRPFVLAPLHDVMPNCTYPLKTEGMYKVLPLLNNEYLKLNKTLVMAIMNTTPDSFSDGGKLEGRVAEVAEMHARNGAHIIDIGGYSTRPGAANVSETEEIERVCTAVETAKRVSGLPISIDTFRSNVAEAAIAAGASIINDVYSGNQDPKILDVARTAQVPLILSHSHGTPQTMASMAPKNLVNSHKEKTAFVNSVAKELTQFVAKAQEKCYLWQLVLDPGFGFAKSAAQDLALVQNFELLQSAVSYKLPYLVGPSRKSFLQPFAQVDTKVDRDPTTVAACTALVQKGASIVRVHDSRIAGAMRFADAVYRRSD